MYRPDYSPKGLYQIIEDIYQIIEDISSCPIIIVIKAPPNRPSFEDRPLVKESTQ